MNNLAKILVVDDTELNIEILVELLGDKYDVLVATNGQSALEIANEESLDMILLDIMMPEMDGFSVCRQLKSNTQTKNIPIIFITAKTDEDSIEYAYDIGGVDYVAKPFRAKEVLSRIATHLAISNHSRLLEMLVAEKTSELKQLNKELEATQREIVYTLGTVCEKRSKETSMHVNRVAEYSKLLALYYGLSEEESEMIRQASPMHDIGKVGVPDNILNKPSSLTEEEFAVIKEHTTDGYEMLKHSNRQLLRLASEIAHGHHEKWNGKGYPLGISGFDIPIHARITALADVFDALSSNRVYKKAMPDEEVFDIIKQGKGAHFEPKLVDIFFEHLDSFLAIRSNLRDS